MALSDFQKKLLERLRAAIEGGEGLSTRDLGQEFDVAPNTILYHLRKLEEKGFILRNVKGKVVRVNSPDERSAVAFLPLLADISCGPPLDRVVDDNIARMIPVPLRLLGRNTKKQLYLVRAVGDSMSPKIEENDFVIFEAGSIPESGDVIIARTEEGFTIKILKETNTEYILKPYNQKYEPFVFAKNQQNKTFNIDGIAVGVFKPWTNLQEGGA